MCRWKSPRPSGIAARNPAADVQDITRVALAAPEQLRHRILTLLDGVRVRMASALLTVADPQRFTILDVRSVETLRAHGELGPTWPDYFPYLELCRDLAQRVGTDLRTLDRALWSRSKQVGTD